MNRTQAIPKTRSMTKYRSRFLLYSITLSHTLSFQSLAQIKKDPLSRLREAISRSSLQEFSNKNDLKLDVHFARIGLLKVSALLVVLSFLFHHACGTVILGPYLKSVISGPAYVSIYAYLVNF